MGRRVVLLSLCLCLAAQKSHDVRILHPKARLVMGGFRGASLPFQAFVERHPDHRLMQLEVWDVTFQPAVRIQMSKGSR